ncbi:MAG TPA: beta-ketoacyl synthase N-terminal-like domain-containing protein [Polyangiaceae bacterium]|jgi:3-oxoacyl-[acyl-carrier-protein] synthase-1/3-oxoacyl-[acyl-carrier-protein] synthase II
MSRVAVLGFGAVSALGEGASAVSSGEVGEPARVGIARDAELEAAGLGKPFAARARAAGLGLPAVGRETSLLLVALRGCLADLDRVRPAWRRERVGMVLGTSAGSMRAAEAAFVAVDAGGDVADLERPTYFGPLAVAARELGIAVDPSVLVLGACASSAIAIGVAARWLERGACDVVLAGGFDDVSVFVAAGFEALRATTATPPPRPFRVGRDGMSLGEGAAVLALARAPEAGRAWISGYVSGFSAACDAVHLTAPDRAGSGLARAAEAALEEAGRPAIDLVGAHATATPFNDAAESRAMARALGAARAREVVVHPFKAQIGHTLGAAGALEALGCLDAMSRGVLPAAAGEGSADPDAPARLLSRGSPGTPRAALKLASAFGGANAALVLTAGAVARPRALRPAFLHAAARVDAEPSLQELAARAGTAVDRLARADALVRLAVAAVALLRERGEAPAGPSVGVVVGAAFATLETNARFSRRLRERGAAFVEPRVFPYTSPNAVAGECSIVFGLAGPSFAVGGGLHAGVEALAVGALLVESGDADAVVVVAVDDVGPVTSALCGGAAQSGAVAAVVSADARGARARVGEVTLRRGPPALDSGPAGHLALVPLATGRVPLALESASPPDAFARVAFTRL